MEILRAFIAIDLDDKTQKALSRIQDELKETKADIRFIKPENIHLTLKFLGDITKDKAEAVAKILEETSWVLKPFSISLTHIGAFSEIEHPEIIWVGANQGRSEVKGFVLRLEEELEKIGFAKEKREFESHVTLGRLRSNLNQNSLIKTLKTFQMDSPIIQNVHSLTLFKSTLTPRGPVYEPLEIFPLK